ncbi:MAG: PhoH family protein [Phycisphaerales bacterium]|nr:PhoH family protein [Phycisphaerales bacterium]
MPPAKSKEARSGAKPGKPAPSPAQPAAEAATTPRIDEEVGIKHFVLDTNVLLHNPNALFVFKEHEVVIPFTVIEELDKLKRQNDDIGRNARECIRHLDRLRSQGRLIDGVRWGMASPTVGMASSAGGSPSPAKNGKNGKHAEPPTATGMVRIDVQEHTRPAMLSDDSPDNRIIAVAYALHNQGKRAVFVSKDLNARIKSDALGIRTEDFENQKVDADRLYNGFTNVVIDGAMIDELYSERMLAVQRLVDAGALDTESAEGVPYTRELIANQFVVMRDADDEGHTGLARRLADTDHLIPVNAPRKPTYGIMPRNVQQTMAMDLLLDDEIRLLTLLGSAGTGKTLLAVAAGMTKTFNEERYEKLLVARPIMPLGRDIGYLPGDKDEKLTAWMQPIFDNLTYLMSTRGAPMQTADSQSSEQRIRKLMADGKLVLEPLTYIRGRSIPHQFMIVDEAQNLTPHEIKTIVSRVGEGTKVVLTGDIQQIDNPYLDQSSNGLSYLIEKMKGLPVVGHVTLNKSERSELASLAASLL